MSDPVIKGVKRGAVRPAPQSASSSSAKARKQAGGKSTVSAASPQPLVKRSASEKAPVRKATPNKSVSSGSRVARTTQPGISKKNAGAASRKKSSPEKSRATSTSSAKTSKTATQAAAKQPSKQAVSQKPTSRPATSAANKSRPSKPATAVMPAPPRQPTRDESAALRAFERAHKEFARGRFAEARTMFRALIEQHAGVVEVTARARTYLAIAEARMRTEASMPRDPDALYDRGVIELNRGEYVAAQEMFERALKRDAESPDVHYALAATRARLGSIDLALQSLERALGLKPTLRARAQHDPDLATLRNEPDFDRLVFPSSRP